MKIVVFYKVEAYDLDGNPVIVHKEDAFAENQWENKHSSEVSALQRAYGSKAKITVVYEFYPEDAIA